MKTFIQSLAILTCVAITTTHAAGAPTAAKTRDVCIVNMTSTGPLNTFVFKDVKPLAAGGAIAVQGLFFTTARKVAPFHGSAVMASDGSVRLGLVVHSSADSTNDFTISGITSADFVGTLKFDSDGDFVPNGTLPVELVDCSTVAVP